MPGRVIAGKYELRREIGRGGMGTVWEAFDQKLRRPVALKLMIPQQRSGPSSRQRFEHEALALAQIRDKHIVQVHDYGFDEDSLSPYIVMELLDGEDLEGRLKREGQLSLAATLNIARQIANGLSAAAAVDVVHRDLKPANVFIVGGEATDAIKLLDFGVAWMRPEGSNEEPQLELGDDGLVGTPAYMSPEQIRGETPHHTQDVWSLGVIAYRALTGELPFERNSLGDLIVSICTDEFTPASSQIPDAPPGLDEFFERALAKDRAKRYQSARELVTALTALTEGEARTTKILVVDDEPDMQQLIKLRFRRQIRRSTHQFLFAQDGEAALEQLRAHPDVDVVMTDINMPIMTGLSLLERIPEVAPLARTIIVSAYGDMGNIRQAMNRGAFDFLTKPIDRKDLQATLAKALAVVAEHRKMASSDAQNRVLRQLTSPRVVERLIALGPAAARAGERVEVTVAHVKLGVDAVTREGTPGAALRQLNAIFEVIVPELLGHGGAVDQFLGDAIMVIYDGPDHLNRALEACVSASTQISALAHRAGPSSPYAQGLAIGVATGMSIAGCVGSTASERLDYAVLGEPVAEASRLAEIANPGEILVSSTAMTAEGWSFEPRRGRAKRVGSTAPAAIHELIWNPVRAALAEDPTMLSELSEINDLSQVRQIRQVREMREKTESLTSDSTIDDGRPRKI